MSSRLIRIACMVACTVITLGTLPGMSVVTAGSGSPDP